MNISQINYTPDFKIDNTSYKAATDSSDKKSFKDTLDKSTGVDKTTKKVENNESSKPKDVESTNEVKKEAAKNDETKVENKVETTSNKNSTETSESDKVSKEEVKSDFLGNKDEEVNEAVISTLSSLLNLLNTIKNQITTSEVKSGEFPTELSSLVTKLVKGEVTLKDVLSNQKLSSDLKEAFKANNFDKLFNEKDGKLGQEVMKLFNLELTDEVKTSDIKTIVNNLVAKVSEVLDNASTNKMVKNLEQKPTVLDKLTTLISKELELPVTKVETNTKTNELQSLLNEQPKKSDFDVLEPKVQYRTNETNSNSVKVSQEDKVSYTKSETTSKEDKFLSGLLSDNSKDEKTLPKVIQFTPLNSTTTVSNVSNETPVVSKNTVVQDVIKTFKYMEDNSLKELTVKIKPKELGEITIKLITQGEVMKASINASNKETYDLLSSKVPEIKHALNTQNIKIEDVNIDFNDSFQSFQSGEGNFSREERNSSQNTTKYSSKDGIEATDAEENLETLSNLNILA